MSNAAITSSRSGRRTSPQAFDASSLHGLSASFDLRSDSACSLRLRGRRRAISCRGSEGEWFEYTYDALGNLIAEDVEVDGESRWTSQYARGTGGMQPMAGVTTPLNAPVARVVGPTSTPSPQDPGQSFFYDGRGHMVAQRYHDPVAASGARITTAGLADPGMNLLPFVWERQFDWNASGRLDSVSVHGMTTSQEVSRYWYGPGGNRIAERVTPLASEPDPTWTQSRRWAGIRTVEPELEAPRFVTSITLGSTLVAQKTVEPNPLQPNQSQVTTRWLGGDHLGSASIVTDENGELVRGVRYEPYGRIRDEWGPEADPEDYELAAVDELFNGKPRNRKAFGLSGGDYALEGYDYGARIYLPEFSRWASADSITPDTVWEANAFTYVRNNPLKYVDPDGHAVKDEDLSNRMEHPKAEGGIEGAGQLLGTLLLLAPVGLPLSLTARGATWGAALAWDLLVVGPVVAATYSRSRGERFGGNEFVQEIGCGLGCGVVGVVGRQVARWMRSQRFGLRSARPPLVTRNEPSFELTYRGVQPSKNPDVVFSGGMRPKGKSANLLAHGLSSSKPPSFFLSTSRSLDTPSPSVGDGVAETAGSIWFALAVASS